MQRSRDEMQEDTGDSDTFRGEMDENGESEIGREPITEASSEEMASPSNSVTEMENSTPVREVNEGEQEEKPKKDIEEGNDRDEPSQGMPPRTSSGLSEHRAALDATVTAAAAVALNEEGLLQEKISRYRNEAASAPAVEVEVEAEAEAEDLGEKEEGVVTTASQARLLAEKNAKRSITTISSRSIDSIDKVGIKVEIQQEIATAVRESLKPGAIRVRGINAGDDSDPLEGSFLSDDTYGSLRASNEQVHTKTSLIRALPVTTEEVEASVRARIIQSAVQAQHVEPVVDEVPSELMESHRKEQTTKSHRKKILVFMVIIVVIGAIVGGVIGSNRSGTEDELTNVPSMVPSQSPTGVLGAIYASVALYPDVPFPGPDAPQHRAIRWLYEEDPNFETYDLKRLIQRYAVLSMAYGTDALETLSFDVLTTVNWFTEKHECEWFGLGCDENLTVTSFDIVTFPEINGVILPEVGLLTHINAVKWVRTNLFGSIPTEIGFLTRLTSFEITSSDFSGAIPSEFGLLTLLETFDLGENQLTGAIPTEIGLLSRLSWFDVNSNSIGGSIPSVIGLLTALTTLNLRSNRLSGLPSELGRLDQLETLVTELNPLKAVIPTELGRLKNLTELFIGLNDLQGRIPSEIGNLTNLRVLRMQRNSLTGTVPSEFGRLQLLEYITVEVNQLTGRLPDQLGNLTRLENFFGGANSFSGSVPSTMCINATRYQEFVVDCEEVACPCCTQCCDDTDPGTCIIIGSGR